MDAYETQQLSRALAENTGLRRLLHTYFMEQRDHRRLQLEQSSGESAVVLRGKCQELTAILGELFKEKP